LQVIQESVRPAKRLFKIFAGYALLGLGIIMLVTPGPGWVIILSGLALLAAEYGWARRLLDRLKAGGARLRNMVLPPSTKAT
jgi:uncharacterized protein (TIGR02611 family)